MHPIKPTAFGLAEHKIQQHHAVLSGKLTALEICNPALYVNVAPRCRMGDLIWIDADDYSFTALIKVTFSSGSDMRSKLVMFKDMDVVDHDAEEAEADYIIKMMGTNKWCVVQRATGDVKIKLIPTKKDAYIQLDDYVRALAA